MDAMLENEVVLIVVAHTDDEVLGAGATIAWHVAKGDSVYAISMTDGVGARNPEQTNKKETRQNMAAKSADILGFKWLKPGNFPDNAMDTVTLLSVTSVIEEAKREVEPTLVYTHSAADLNIDHRVVSQATLTAFRPQPEERWKEIRAFEVPSATDYGHDDITGRFQPNLYISIEPTWGKKREALEAYSNEMRDAPHTRSFEGIENLARYRGNQAGLALAEAFHILRKIER